MFMHDMQQNVSRFDGATQSKAEAKEMTLKTLRDYPSYNSPPS